MALFAKRLSEYHDSGYLKARLDAHGRAPGARRAGAFRVRHLSGWRRSCSIGLALAEVAQLTGTYWPWDTS